MVRNNTMLNTLANAYKGAAVYGALFTGAGPASGASNTASNECTGGSPAYARKVLAWGSPAAGVVSSTAVTFDIASGTTVTYFGVTTSGTAATADVQDSVSITSQNFASQGTYQITPTYTQT
jgi:hypothetical protein